MQLAGRRFWSFAIGVVHGSCVLFQGCFMQGVGESVNGGIFGLGSVGFEGILGVRVYSCHALSECKKATAELGRRQSLRMWKCLDARGLVCGRWVPCFLFLAQIKSFDDPFSQVGYVAMPQLTLKHFILQQEVLNLYRRAIRATRGCLSIHNPAFLWLILGQEYQILLAARRPFIGLGVNSIETGTFMTL